MPSLRRIVRLLLLPPLAAASLAHATDILFVGNSFTYGFNGYNALNITDANGTGMGGVPALFKKLATEGGHSDVNVTIEAVGGQSLAYHLANKSQILGRPWDWVVLQEYSTGPLTTHPAGNVPAFRTAVQDIAALLRAHNPAVRIVLYETWARPDQVDLGRTLSSMQAELRESNSAAAADFSLHGWAPVGDAFLQALADGVAYDPNTGSVPGSVNLWNGDRYHANAYGAYLAGLVFYNRILGGDPRQLPTGSGSAVADLSLNATSAGKLQQVAAKLMTAIPVPPPSITAQPASVAVWPGSSASFKVVAEGADLAYQWRRNGVAIPGATGATLAVSGVQAGATGRYDVVVTNTAGESVVSAPAALTLADRSSTRTLLFDFGSASSGYLAPSPDPSGRRWNQLTESGAGATLTALVDHAGSAHATAYLFVAAPFAGVNTAGYNANGLYPAAAQRDSFFVTGYGTVAGPNRAELLFGGLRADSLYTFKIFAAREAAGNRVTRYTVTGLPSAHLNAANNTTGTVTLGPTAPSGIQTLSLVVQPLNASGIEQEYGYLGVLELAEQSPAASPLATWASLSGLSGADAARDADPDADGVPNLLEYALGRDALAPDPAATLPAVSATSVSGFEYLSILVGKNPSASGLAYVVEVSSDLQTWASGQQHVTLLAESASLLQARDNTPLSSGTRRFIRLRVTAD